MWWVSESLVGKMESQRVCSSCPVGAVASSNCHFLGLIVLRYQCSCSICNHCSNFLKLQANVAHCDSWSLPLERWDAFYNSQVEYSLPNSSYDVNEAVLGHGHEWWNPAIHNSCLLAWLWHFFSQLAVFQAWFRHLHAPGTHPVGSFSGDTKRSEQL